MENQWERRQQDGMRVCSGATTRLSHPRPPARGAWRHQQSVRSLGVFWDDSSPVGLSRVGTCWSRRENFDEDILLAGLGRF